MILSPYELSQIQYRVTRLAAEPEFLRRQSLSDIINYFSDYPYTAGSLIVIEAENCQCGCVPLCMCYQCAACGRYFDGSNEFFACIYEDLDIRTYCSTGCFHC